MAKRPYRTQEQQEYRDNLAHDIKNLRSRYGDTGKELAQTLLDDQKYHHRRYINSLGDGRKLNKEDALKMIEEDPTLVSVHLDQFKGLDSEVAQKLIEAGEVTYFSRNLASFEGLDKNIANELLDDAYPEDPTLFLVHIESFKELDKDILLKFLKKLPKRKDFRYDSDYVAYGNRIYNLIKNNIDKFEGVSLDKDLASKMIEAGLVTQVVENIDDFEGLDLNNIKIA